MRNNAEIFILTGTTQSGKTTALKKWSANKSVGGILTPIVGGYRVAYNLAEDSYFPFEAVGDDKEMLTIGRYNFLQESFFRMNTLLKHQVGRKYDWLIIDEIGPLELDMKGLHEGLIYVLEKTTPALLLVVRESLVDNVISFFSLTPAHVMHVEDLAGLSKLDSKQTIN